MDAPIFHNKKRYSYKSLDFWPEGGLIHLEDRDDGEYTAMTRKTALLRIKAINDTIHYWPHASERDEMHKLVSDMIECVREAKRQGDPTDPSITESKIRELKKKRTVVCMDKKIILGSAIPKLTKDGLFGTEDISLINSNILLSGENN